MNELAFGQRGEADLVDALRRHDALTFSFVAVEEGEVIGHIAFSQVTIASPEESVTALGLAPLAVLPRRQRCGIGSALARAGLEACAETTYELVIVLGHPEYYRRFGFETAAPHGLSWEREAPVEAFMVKALRPGALSRVSGVVKFRPEFDGL